MDVSSINKCNKRNSKALSLLIFLDLKRQIMNQNSKGRLQSSACLNGGEHYTTPLRLDDLFGNFLLFIRGGKA